MQAAARAHANIALVKYWGKRDAALNLPATGSISVTLEALYTDTQVVFDQSLVADEVALESGGDTNRVAAFLDLVRQRAGIATFARVHSRNNFPTGAGLASSASGFAALASAACAAAGLNPSAAQLSALARRGSGSAARSVFGGYVEMNRGAAADGEDAHALPLLGAQDWPLMVVIAITEHAAKATGSSAGMAASAATSPFYAGWLQSAEADLAEMRAAIAGRDLERLGRTAEHSCLKMHALMLSSRPPLRYWNPATLAAWQAVEDLRAQGVAAWCTVDAGPQLKAVCAPADAGEVAAALRQAAGVREVRVSCLGPGAHQIEPPWPQCW